MWDTGGLATAVPDAKQKQVRTKALQNPEQYICKKLSELVLFF